MWQHGWLEKRIKVILIFVKKRKNDSIFIVSCVLDEMDEWKRFFLSHPKKDDLADSLLQGIAQYCKQSQSV